MDNNSKPSISVIIPSFNAEKWIIKAIKSIENQTYKPDEIIIVDDGSTDNTVSVVKSYCSSISINIITQHNKGPAFARNRGAEFAIGDYIAFLDADDEWVTCKLEKQLDCIDFNSFSTSNCFLIDEDSNIIGENVNRISGSRADILEQIYLGKISMLTPGLLIPRNKFNNIGGFDVSQRYKEDHLLIISLISEGLSLKYIEESLFKVRVHPQSGRNSIDETVLLLSFFAFSEKCIQKIPSLYRLQRNFRSEVFYILSKNSLGKKPLSAFKYAFKSFLNYPQLKNIMAMMFSLLPFDKNSIIKVKNMVSK